MAAQRRAALIFAVDEYDHPDLQRLSAPMADADALADTLGRAELGGFSVEICHNPTSTATTERLEDFLSECRAGDLALLHFSGHGLKDESGSLYLATCNTIPTRLASTAVDTTLINMLMRRSRAGSIVLLLDCCYGGAFERGMTARAAGRVAVREQFSQEPLGGGRGRVVITASSAVQYAFEGTRLSDGQNLMEPSLFTGAVVEGIRSGAADRDGDGLISLSELYEYVYERVLEQSPHQTPAKWEYGLEGELIISKSPRRHIRPAELPEQLVEIIHHAYPVARRGAIDELTRLAAGDNLPMAIAAVQALEDMRDDDSRSIALAATTALDGLSISVPVPAIAFGEVSLGAPPPVETLDLIGPPLVQAVEIAAEPTAFTAHLDGRTVRVTMDTSSVAELAGTLTMNSPIGAVVVALTGAVREVDRIIAPAVHATAPDSVGGHSPPPVTVDERAVEEPAGADPAADPAGPDPAGADPTADPAGPDLSLRTSMEAEEGSAEAAYPPASKSGSSGGSAGEARRPRLLGPALAAAGGVFFGIAIFVPWVSGVFGQNSLWVDFTLPGIVLLLPAIVLVAAASVLCLPGETSPPAVGVVFGCAASGFLSIIETVAVVADDSSGHWQGGVLLQLSGVALATAGGTVALTDSTRISRVVIGKHDVFSFAGAAMIAAALVLAIIDLNSYGESVMPWMWAFPLLTASMAGPVPFLDLAKDQRTFVFPLLATYFALWIVPAVVAVSTGTYSWIADSYWWLMILFAGTMLAGCVLGQISTGSRRTAENSPGVGG